MALARKIDHIAIAVKDLEAAIKTFGANFGFPVTSRGDIEDLGIRTAMLQIGDAELELFAPTVANNPATKFLAERGEGLYVLSLEVENLDDAIQALSRKGIEIGAPLTNPDGRRLAFVSPKATHGVSLQLIEPANTATGDH